ncbi:MAG TPA: hypothetical protein VFA37_07295 [Gaiellaceae bacterium]|nr:hypothetical protein [Gaiellaceae bacterium]
MSSRSEPAAAFGGLGAIPRAPRWLVGWWLTGRVAVLAAACAIKPSVWTLDRWDGRWYRMVAQYGYLLVPGRPSDPAFFPLYPILLRGVHALGIGWGAAGPLLSNVAFLLALSLFYELSRTLFSETLARRATTYLAVFPLSYVFSMAYPEAFVLVLVAAAPIAALRGRWWLAAICAAAAALARPEGLFVALPLAGIAWQQRERLSPAMRGAAGASLLAGPAALISFPLYLGGVLHDPLAWTRAQAAWGRQFRITGLLAAFAQLPEELGRHPWLVRDVLFFFVYLLLIYAAWRNGTPRTWLLAAAAVVVLPVFTGSFESDARFGLLAPPLFWGLAALTRSTRTERAVSAVLLVLLVAATASLAYVFP